MFVDHIRAAIGSASRRDLPAFKQVVWKGVADAVLSDEDAHALLQCIHEKETARAAPAPDRRPRGKPRTPESLERRRELAGDRILPPWLRRKCAQGECAVLVVMLREVRHKGSCRLSIEEIASRSGCSRTLVKNTLRKGRSLGLLGVQHRRIRAFRHSSNVVTVVCPRLARWIGWRCPSQGVNEVIPTKREDSKRGSENVRYCFISAREDALAFAGRSRERLRGGSPAAL